MKTELNFSFKFGIFAAVVAAFIALAPETSAGFFDGVRNFFGSSDTKTEGTPEAQFTKPLMQEGEPADRSLQVVAPAVLIADAPASDGTTLKSEDDGKTAPAAAAPVKEADVDESAEKKEAAVQEAPVEEVAA